MTLDELKVKWQPPHRDTLNAQALWNSQADDIAYTKIPTFEDSGFLRLLDTERMLDQSYDVLDIGCGTGVYAAAIAGRVRSVRGFDLAPLMLGKGREILAREKIENVTIEQADWRELDLKKLGLENRFDLVIAHTTPAICDLATFEKMIRAGRKFCAVSVFTRPHQPMMEAVHEMFDAELDFGYFAGYLETSMTYMFDYLFQSGYSPKFFYEQTDYHFVQKLEDSYIYYLDAIREKKKLSTSEERQIKDYLAAQAVDGIVTEKMRPTIVTLYWNIQDNAGSRHVHNC